MQDLIGSLDALKSTDPETYEAIVAEEQRQEWGLAHAAGPASSGFGGCGFGSPMSCHSSHCWHRRSSGCASG